MQGQRQPVQPIRQGDRRGPVTGLWCQVRQHLAGGPAGGIDSEIPASTCDRMVGTGPISLMSVASYLK